MDGERLTVNGIELEVLRRGHGHARSCCCTAWIRSIRMRGFSTCSAGEAEIIAPSSPGFGNTQTAARFRHDLRSRPSLSGADRPSCPSSEIALIGLSFGGWLAAEIAVACAHKLDRLILADPVGIKLGDRETRDIARCVQPEPGRGHGAARGTTRRRRPSYDAMSDDELVVHARNREALCLYAWHPCLYNPQLKQLARPASACRPWSCGARATGSSPPNTDAPMPG